MSNLTSRSLFRQALKTESPSRTRYDVIFSCWNGRYLESSESTGPQTGDDDGRNHEISNHRQGRNEILLNPWMNKTEFLMTFCAVVFSIIEFYILFIMREEVIKFSPPRDERDLRAKPTVLVYHRTAQITVTASKKNS